MRTQQRYLFVLRVAGAAHSSLRPAPRSCNPFHLSPSPLVHVVLGSGYAVPRALPSSVHARQTRRVKRAAACTVPLSMLLPSLHAPPLPPCSSPLSMLLPSLHAPPLSPCSSPLSMLLPSLHAPCRLLCVEAMGAPRCTHCTRVGTRRLPRSCSAASSGATPSSPSTFLLPLHHPIASAFPVPLLHPSLPLPLLPAARLERAAGGGCNACRRGRAHATSSFLHPSLYLHAPSCPVSPALALSELLEAYAACADGAEVIAAQHRWMEREAELAQARHAGTDVPSPGSSGSDSEGSDSDDDAAPLFRNPNHGAGWGRGGRGGEDEDEEEDGEEDVNL
ncbi:unnamed protein product [Closterium sp. NIES-54]